VRWLGVPYARAERFGAPSLVPFDASRAYDRFGPAAPQPLDSALGSIVPGMRVSDTSEHDCLTLNIWAPDAPGPHPVLVWFPGGSFVIGASAQGVYDGTLLSTEQAVVVVTVNYRLGALGFLDARPLGGLANCGVRDAIAALQWVREHIGSFGGDPARVVAFGESAGGGLVLHALASPMSRGLMSGAIVQSGATFATLDEERAAIVRDALAKEAGGADLTTLPVDDLVAAQVRAMTELLGTIGMMPFHPMVDGDVLHARPADALDNDVPMIVGTTADEMALFVAGNAPPRVRLVKRVARYLKIDDGEAVVQAYEQAVGDDPGAVWQAIFSDNEMQVPARAMCDAHTGPTYTYLFTWEGPNVGACHGIDIPFAFGNFVDGWAEFVGPGHEPVSRLMRDSWASFARTGRPGWPEYPAARILGRESHVADTHPLFVRGEAL
jgi:para-nitrobenzyl esterase